MILPEEIENQQFEVSFRGYNTREVDEFLTRVHSDLGEMIKEQEVLKRKIAAAELIAKDAKDHEEEFIASLQNDRDEAQTILANAKTEGERIIREAKNAASGIMSEVRRRAGDITSESRKASADIIEAAQREAENIKNSAKEEAANITASANATAENRLFAAQTESDNILAAASAESRIIMEEARKTAADLTKKATKSASLYETYINEIRASAEKLCFEIDAELKNSASRIALLGKRISASKSPEKPETDEIDETGATDGTDIGGEADDTMTAAATKTTSVEEVKGSAPAHASAEPVKSKPRKESAQNTDSGEGYFTEEYRLVMSELFGDESKETLEDDDTYDYLELANIIEASDNDSDNDAAEDLGDDTITSEYTGIPVSGRENDAADVFGDDALDRIYKSPSQEDINDILNN